MLIVLEQKFIKSHCDFIKSVVTKFNWYMYAQGLLSRIEFAKIGEFLASFEKISI